MPQVQKPDATTAPPFLWWSILWGAGLAIPIVAVGVDIFTSNFDRVPGRDFTNFWVGGQLVLEGRSGCAFDTACFRAELREHLGIISLQNYSYPPHVLLLNAPFALLPYFIALGLWTALGALFFVYCARPYLPRGFSPALAVMTPAAGFTIWGGQYGFLFGGLWLLTFAALEHRPARAGITAGLMTFKPHLGLLLALTILARWRLVAIAIALTVTAMLVLLSAAIFGTDSWLDFLRRTTAEQADILTRTTRDFYVRLMPSAYPRWGWWGQAIFALFALTCLWRVRAVPIAQLTFPVATATFLLLPYAFVYDMTVVCLGFALILFRQWHRLGVARLGLFIAAFNAPQLALIAPAIVPLILAVALFEQCRLLLADQPHVVSGRHPPRDDRATMGPLRIDQ